MLPKENIVPTGKEMLEALGNIRTTWRAIAHAVLSEFNLVFQAQRVLHEVV